MKKLLFLFSFILLLGCDSNKKNREEEKIDKLELAINNAENSKIETDTIFLGIRFGMTSKQVTGLLDELIENKKLYISDGGYYTYDFNTKLGPIKSKISTKYHNDSLYNLSLKFESIGNLTSPLVLMSEANRVYKDKAIEDGFEYFIYKDVMDDYAMTYIKNNLIVEFNCGIEGSMSYINAPILKLIEKEKVDKKNETASDL